jgi:hypothetical protein
MSWLSSRMLFMLTGTAEATCWRLPQDVRFHGVSVHSISPCQPEFARQSGNRSIQSRRVPMSTPNDPTQRMVPSVERYAVRRVGEMRARGT